jgi:hypothetical protein
VNRPDVTVGLLQQVTEILLHHLNETAGPTITFDKDLYWGIPVEARFNPYSEPSEFVIGQLSECIERLTLVAENPDEAISYGLVWLGEVMKAIGEVVVE